VQGLKELQRQGMSTGGISKLTGWDRKTIRKYLQQPSALPEYGPRQAQVIKLDPFKPYLKNGCVPGYGTRVKGFATSGKLGKRSTSRANSGVSPVDQLYRVRAGIQYSGFYVISGVLGKHVLSRW
jgi:hypothetical protein